MDFAVALDVLRLALLATVNVALWTVRVAFATRGRRALATGLAGVEAVLFSLVFGAVVSTLAEDPVRVLAYGVGVAAGTALGMHVDERLSTPRRSTDAGTREDEPRKLLTP